MPGFGRQAAWHSMPQLVNASPEDPGGDRRQGRRANKLTHWKHSDGADAAVIPRLKCLTLGLLPMLIGSGTCSTFPDCLEKTVKTSEINVEHISLRKSLRWH